MTKLKAVPGVREVRSPLDQDGAQQISPTDPRIAFAEIQFEGTSKQHHVPEATATAVEATAQAAASPSLQIELSGDLFQHQPSLGPAEGIDLLMRHGAEGLIVTPDLERFETPGLHR